MLGRVSDTLAMLIPVEILTAAGPREVMAAIDTGFDGYMGLSAIMVRELMLPFHSIGRCELADGSRVHLRRYRAKVRWHGQERAVIVVQADGGPLVGASLLRGSDLAVEVIPGGAVHIRERVTRG